MNLSEFLMPEFQHEMASTRKMLSALPEAELDFKPHEKAMSLAELANHLAEIPTWIPITLLQPELDFSTLNYTPTNYRTVAALLEAFDTNVAEAQKLLQEAQNETFQEQWTMRNGETVYFTLPKMSVYRMFVMNHTIHHRGQMSTYIRSVGGKVPGMYGPTADEN
ncbi:DinB family protein [Flavobacterium inviolabile]|uniref:DinB family protein n=1 Tax=Flavobacterium inviolabile TaxID=2748320 RepID=UPI0015B21F09|nr:DinB family protein [Flavobacterium inviolabile]